MSYSEAEKLEIQKQMFGMTKQDVIDYLKPQVEFSGKEMLMMGMLSDAQHLMYNGQEEEARQLLNRVKFVLSTMMNPENKEL